MRLAPQPPRSRVDSNYKAFENLRERIIACERCPRLVAFRESIAQTKRKGFSEWEYWGKPVPSFGSCRAKLLVLGLAPAAHGGNRTGRVFTGDPSAQFLMKHLHEAGFANQPFSTSREDGLRLHSTYIMAAVKCVPPDNKPTAEEAQNCSGYLAEELHLQSEAKAILALGRFAFDAYKKFLAGQLGIGTSGLKFKHGARYQPAEGLPTLYASYHPSPRNTNTGTLTSEAFRAVLQEIRREVG